MPRSRIRPIPRSLSMYHRRSLVSGYRFGITRESETKILVIASRGSPRTWPTGHSQLSAIRGAATRACAKRTRASTRLRKKRSARVSDAASSRWSRYAVTMLALCARYHDLAGGSLANSAQHAALQVESGPLRPRAWARVSAVSRSSRSLTARHQGLPGASLLSGLRRPRRSCQPMNPSAARRYGRYSSGRPGSASYRDRINATRAAGSSRTEATRSAAYSTAVVIGHYRATMLTAAPIAVPSTPPPLGHLE